MVALCGRRSQTGIRGHYADPAAKVLHSAQFATPMYCMYLSG